MQQQQQQQLEIRVSFRGKPIVVAGVGSETSVEGLKERLEGLTGVPVANQKLVRARVRCQREGSET